MTRAEGWLPSLETLAMVKWCSIVFILASVRGHRRHGRANKVEPRVMARLEHSTVEDTMNCIRRKELSKPSDIDNP